MCGKYGLQIKNYKHGDCAKLQVLSDMVSIGLCEIYTWVITSSQIENNP
jgi:hypothetical protein